MVPYKYIVVLLMDSLIEALTLMPLLMFQNEHKRYTYRVVNRYNISIICFLFAVARLVLKSEK